MGEEEQGRVVFHADLQLVGEPDRGALRTASRVRAEQLEPPQPRRAHPATPRSPAMEKRERSIPETPARPTQGTSPRPIRERPQGWLLLPAPRRLTPARTFLVKALARAHHLSSKRHDVLTIGAGGSGFDVPVPLKLLVLRLKDLVPLLDRVLLDSCLRYLPLKIDEVCP